MAENAAPDIEAMIAALKSLAIRHHNDPSDEETAHYMRATEGLIRTALVAGAKAQTVADAALAVVRCERGSHEQGIAYDALVKAVCARFPSPAALTKKEPAHE